MCLPPLSYDAVQYLCCIQLVNIKLVPVPRFWNLCVKHRLILSDVFALFFSDFLNDCRWCPSRGIIQHIEVNGMPLTLCLCHDAVFLFLFGLYSYIVFCDPLQHIPALAHMLLFRSAIIAITRSSFRSIVFFIFVLLISG